MGDIVKLQCSQCQWEQELFLGGGLRDCDMKTVSQLVPKKKYWQLKAALAAMRPPRFAIERRVGYCQNCQTIGAVPVVRFFKPDGTARDITGICEQCGKAVEIFPSLADAQDKLRCQVCGEPITSRSAGHWD